MMELIHAKDVAADTKVRNEMDGCAGKIDRSCAELSLRMDRIEQEVSQGRVGQGPQEPPGLQAASALGEGTQALAKTVKTMSEQILNVESTMNTHERAITTCG